MPQLWAVSTLHTPCTSASPAGTGAQVPRRLGWLQLTQGPVQATSQQTPSAQKPESHCDPDSQAMPAACWTSQRPRTQAPLAQSLGQSQA